MSTTATNIFIGAWQNHNDGTWPTWTLTLKQRDGGVLFAALVLFVGFAATQAWNVVKLILHQVLLRSRRDGLDQQLQAMLRNSGTHAGAAWFSIRIPLGWRRQRGLMHGLARSSPILIVSLVLMACGRRRRSCCREFGLVRAMSSWSITRSAVGSTSRIFIVCPTFKRFQLTINKGSSQPRSMLISAMTQLKARISRTPSASACPVRPSTGQ